MATRITVVKNQNGQFLGWMCKHSSHAVQQPDCDGHVTLCERCASAVKNGADLLADSDLLKGDHHNAAQHNVEPTKIAVVAIAKRAAAAAR